MAWTNETAIARESLAATATEGDFVKLPTSTNWRPSAAACVSSPSQGSTATSTCPVAAER
jgi:hypothetical protein